MASRKTAKPYLRLVRVPGGFKPATAMDDERLSMDYPIGQQYEADLKRPRSLPRMRLWWAIMHFLYHNDRFGYASPEKISDAILIDIGVCTPERRLSGEIVMVPDSISFRRMDEATMTRTMDSMLTVAEKHWGIPIRDLIVAGERLNARHPHVGKLGELTKVAA